MSARINKIMLVMFQTNLKIYVGIIKYLARVYIYLNGMLWYKIFNEAIILK